MPFFALSLTSQVFANSSVDENHLICNSDDECELVSVGDCCGPTIPVNQKFIQKYFRPMRSQCKNEKHACQPVNSKCDKGRCGLFHVDSGSQAGEEKISICEKDSDCIIVPYSHCCGSTKRAI